MIAILVTLSFISVINSWSSTYSHLSSNTEAYSYRTNQPEQKAIDIVNNQRLNSFRVSSPQNYIREVCSEISSHTSNKFLKAKLAHDVTALLLFYDDANYWNNSIPQQDLAYVLKRRRAVCEGYANLFKALCDGLNLPCEKVHGYARGVGANEQGWEDPTDSNHAWNMVKIENNWYLVDCTWDSGHMNGRTSVQEYNTEWLFVQPEHMIYSHYPSRASHQLLKSPLTPQEFTLLPNLRPTFFEAATLQELPERNNHVIGISILNYQLKAGNSLSFNIRDTASDSSISNSVFYEQDSQTGGITVFFSPPNPGTYRVNVFNAQGRYGGHFFITTSISKPSHINLSTKEGRQALLASQEYTSFSTKNTPQAIAQARASSYGNASNNTASTYTPSYRTPNFSSLSFYDFLDSILPQEDGAMGGIFIGGGDLHQIQEMENQHNLSVGLLVPALFLGDWSNIFYLGGKVEFQRNIDGQKTTAYTLLAGTTISLLLLHPYIEGGVGLSNLNPVFEFTSGYDFSFTVQSPIALGVFYRFQWYSDWQKITNKKQYFGARILIRPHNFSMPSFLEFGGGLFVVSLGYIFPTNLLNTKSFNLGSSDNFGFTLSLETADYFDTPFIIGLSYRKSTKTEETSFSKIIPAHQGYEQELIFEEKVTTRKTLMLEFSLGWQLIPHIVLYGGGGIGLAHLTVEEERSKNSSFEFAWQVQGGIRFNVMDFLYTRVQVAYLHTKELGLSLHLGFSLF